jgi:hypothetical protein
MLYDKGKINAVMIIAPKGVYRNWLSSEIPTHMPSHIQYKSVLWTALTSKTKDKEYQSLFETDYNLHIFIMNVEALSTPKGLTFARKFLSCHNTLIAVDESTTIKTPKAARTKNIVSIASLAKYRRILTGSPVTKSPLDLYTQCKFLNEDLLGFSSYYSFQNRYACMVDRWFGGRKVSIVKSYQRLDELSKIIEQFSYRVLKEDCLDLPEKVYIKREIELTEDQLKHYSTMKATAMALLKGDVVRAPHVLTQLMRLHQITCGHLTTESGEIVDIKSNRIKELLKILEETNGKAIIIKSMCNDPFLTYEACVLRKPEAIVRLSITGIEKTMEQIDKIIAEKYPLVKKMFNDKKITFKENKIKAKYISNNIKKDASVVKFNLIDKNISIKLQKQKDNIEIMKDNVAFTELDENYKNITIENIDKYLITNIDDTLISKCAKK